MEVKKDGERPGYNYQSFLDSWNKRGFAKEQFVIESSYPVELYSRPNTLGY